jgi:hypothetical protein
MNENEVKDYQAMCHLRDALLFQHGWNYKFFCKFSAQKGTNIHEGNGPLILAQYLERALPHRMQLEETSMLLKIMRYEATNQRQLLKDLRAAWLRAGFPFKRGVVFPRAAFTEKALFELVGMVRALLNNQDHDAFAEDFQDLVEAVKQEIADTEKLRLKSTSRLT